MTDNLPDTRVRETTPAALLDADQALGEALDVVRGWDGSIFGNTAIHYAFGCQRRALADLAMRVRDGSAVPAATGWALATGVTHQAPNIINMLLHHPKEPGGWLIQVEYARNMTPEAYARTNEIEKASGKSLVEQVLDPSPAVEAIQADPASYEPLQPTTEVNEIAIRAIDMGDHPAFGRGGIPFGIEPREVDHVSGLWPTELTLHGRSSGLVCRLRSPETIYGATHAGFELEHERFMDAPAFLVFQHLQDILDANGLGIQVANEADRLADEAFTIVGSGRLEIISNAAVATVHADGGRISKRAVQAASALTQAIAARDLAPDLECVDTLVVGLRDQGAKSEDDGVRLGDDKAWLASVDGQDRLMLDTENGLFSMAWGENGITIDCTLEGQHYPVAHFLRDGSELQGDWAPEGDGVVIPYLPRNIRSLNYLARTLPRVAGYYEPPSAPAP